MLRLFRLWRVAGRDLRILVHALRHPDRPGWLVPALVVIGAYALDPFNLALPALGVVDDFVILPLLLHGLVKLLPSPIRAGRA